MHRGAAWMEGGRAVESSLAAPIGEEAREQWGAGGAGEWRMVTFVLVCMRVAERGSGSRAVLRNAFG